MWHLAITIALISSVLAATGPAKKDPPIITIPAIEFNRTEHQDRINSILLYSPVQAFNAKFRIVAASQDRVAGTVHYRYRVIFADDRRQRPCELGLSEPPRKARKMMLEAPTVSYTCSYNPKRFALAGVQCLGCPEVLSQAELAKDAHEDRVERILESEGISGYEDLTIVSGISEVGAGTKYKYNVELVLDGSLVTCALTALENLRASDPAERRQYLSLCSRVPMSY